MGQLATFDGEKKIGLVQDIEDDGGSHYIELGTPFQRVQQLAIEWPWSHGRAEKKQQGQDHGLIRGTPRVEMIYNHAEKLLKSPSARMYAALDLATPVPGRKNANKSQIRL